MSTTTTYVTLNHESCVACGVVFGVEDAYERELRRTHKIFYCPNGHQQYYSAKTEAEVLTDRLAAERARHDQTLASLEQARRDRDHQEARARVIRGHLTRVKKRIGAGVCPCCRRSFGNVARHMKTQHPTYGEAK